MWKKSKKALLVWGRRFKRDAHKLLGLGCADRRNRDEVSEESGAAQPKQRHVKEVTANSASNGLISRSIHQPFQLGRVAELDLVKPSFTFGIAVCQRWVSA